MRNATMFICCVLLFLSATALAQTSPLARFSPKWDDIKYLECNTAGTVKYMSDSEKEVIYILNLARTNPKLFCETVVKTYPEINHDYNYKTSNYFRSLIKKMTEMGAVGILHPDSLSYNSAFMHASLSGKTGYIGHDRQDEASRLAQHFWGECCDYGHNNALDIVMSLLIDQDVASLGHREICLDKKYTLIGVSIQPHTEYKYTSTLDFYY